MKDSRVIIHSMEAISNTKTRGEYHKTAGREAFRLKPIPRPSGTLPLL